MSAWQPIDSAPKDGMVLITWHNASFREWNVRVAMAMNGRLCGFDSPYSIQYRNATHWMPLPEPPEGA